MFNNPFSERENNGNNNHPENYEKIDNYDENELDENEQNNNCDDEYWGNEGIGDDFNLVQQTDS